MARARKRSTLVVALNGRRVGVLERAPNGAVSFAYDETWLGDTRRAMPVSLSLPLREERYAGAEVSNFFDNLLPDNLDIRKKIAAKTGAEGTDAFNLLNRIGRDCVGALQFLAEDEQIPAPAPPQSEPLSDAEVADILRNLASAPLGVRTDGSRELRISIAGAQEKTALLWDNGWRLPIGATPTTHILKPAMSKLPNGMDMHLSVENEHFCLALCRAFGLTVATSCIVDFEDQHVLVVERFDRVRARDGRLLRMPQEDFCQALGAPSTLKYNSDGGPGLLECLSLLNGSDTPSEDRMAFLKAQIVFWLMGATDGHAKNFSLFLSPGGRYRMTPIYDVLSVQPCYDARQLRKREYRFAMAVGGSRHYQMDKILPHHFREIAAAAGMSSDVVDALCVELSGSVDKAAEQALRDLPDGAPTDLTNSIIDAARRRARLLAN